MPIPVTDLISPTDPSDTYATHDSRYGKGGLHEVADTTARDAITVARRTAGMLVCTQDTLQYYVLGNDLTTWTPLSTSAAIDTIELEAGETMTAGTPVYISTNKLYTADNVTNTAVIGIISADVTATFTGTAVPLGKITLSGLTAGAEYHLGAGVIQTSAPASGRVIKLGRAISTTVLLVNIQQSILLS